MLFFIINLLKDYNYNINKDNCSEFISELIYRLESDQIEQVNKVKDMLRRDKEHMNNEFDR